jgi:hypothetical protein
MITKIGLLVELWLVQYLASKVRYLENVFLLIGESRKHLLKTN